MPRNIKPIDFELADKLFYVSEEAREDGKLTMVLRHKYDKITRGKHVRIKKGELAGYVSKNGYQKVKIGSALFGAHRVIWAMINQVGDFPELDHIDRDRANNHITNLRLDVGGINNMNRDKHGKEPFKGWYVHRGSVEAKWFDPITGKRRSKSFGKPTEESMARATEFSLQIRKELWNVDLRG